MASLDITWSKLAALQPAANSYGFGYEWRSMMLVRSYSTAAAAASAAKKRSGMARAESLAAIYTAVAIAAKEYSDESGRDVKALMYANRAIEYAEAGLSNWQSAKYAMNNSSIFDDAREVLKLKRSKILSA